MDDPLEKEADRVADRVVHCDEPISSASGPSTSQRLGADRTLQRSALARAPISAPPIVHEAVSSDGQPLDATTRARMEPRFDYDFSRVRVHTSGLAADSARAIQARAYTSGNHIVFGNGQYDPSSGRGQRLIAHELTHVIQQGSAEASSVIRRDADGTQASAGESDAQVSLGVLDNPIAGGVLEQVIGPTQWELLREFLRGAKGGLASAPPEQVARIEERFRHQGLRDQWEYGKGLGLGIALGVYGSVEGLVEAVVALVRLPYDVSRFLTVRLPELAVRYGPRIAAFLVEGDGIQARAKRVVDGFLQDPANAARQLGAILGAIKGDALGQVRALGHASAERFLAFVEEPWFAFGVDVGKVVGQVLFEVLLAAASDFIGNVVKEAVSLGARLVARIGTEVVESFHALARLVGRGLEWLDGIGRKIVGEVGEVFEEFRALLAKLRQLFEELAADGALADTGTGIKVPVRDISEAPVFESRAVKPGQAGRGTRGPGFESSAQTERNLGGTPAGRRVNMPSWRTVEIDMDEVASGHMEGGDRLAPGTRKTCSRPV